MYQYPKASATTFEYIQEVFRLNSMKNKIVFILGDFNDNLLVSNSKVSNIIKSLKLTPIIDKPTSYANILNCIRSCYFILLYIYSCNFGPQEIVDHDLISVTVNISNPKR